MRTVKHAGPYQRFTTDHIPFRNLVFDSRIQRALVPARVKKLIANWNLLDVGAITVSVRDNKFVIIDGQHRVRAAMDLGLGDTKVLCHVYRGLSEEEEARKFLALNDARSVSTMDRYKVGLVALDSSCVGVYDILKLHGLMISNSGADGTIKCVSKVLSLYDKPDGPALLDGVCRLIKESWGTRAAAFEQVVFSAMGMILARYDGELEQSVLTKKLAGYRGGPAALAGDARGLSDYKPITVTRAAAEIIIDTYNKGRRAGQLSPL